MARRRYSVDLVRDMAECDANYARMHRLLPELFDRDQRRMELPLPPDRAGVDARTLTFRVTERCPYTTTLTVRFPEGEGAWHEMVPAPALTVRLYHDARTAEVVGYQGADRFRGRYEYPNAQGRHPDEKAQLNRFLGEYLGLCIAQGRDARAVTVSMGDD